MKKLIFIFLLFPLFGNCQTQWGDSLQKWERLEARRSYGWFDSLTAAQKAIYINRWYSLKLKAAHEARLNAINDSSANETTQINARLAYINHLKSLGYKCDNSLADWKKAYNHPEWFGKFWEQKAIFVQGISTLNDFLSFCRQYGY